MGKQRFITKNGKVIPIGGPRRAGAVIAGGTLAAVLAVGQGGALTGAGVVSGAGSGLSSGLSSVMRVKVNKAKKTMRSGKAARAWRQMGLRRGKSTRSEHFSCVSNSYGEVQAYFVTHPCRSLRRLAVPLNDGKGNSLLLAVSWVRMPSAFEAGRFKRLVDEHGKGNVKPLGMRIWQRQHGVKFTGHNYDSRRSGVTVVVAEAEPLRGSPSREVLQATATLGAHTAWRR